MKFSLLCILTPFGNNLGTIAHILTKKEDFEFFKTLYIQLVAGAGFEPTTFGL